MTRFPLSARWLRHALAATIVVCAAAAPAAAQNLVTNGTFVTTNGQSDDVGTGDVTGWSAIITNGLTMAYLSGGAGPYYAPASYYPWVLWTSANSSNGWNGTSPNGTNYIGMDGGSGAGLIGGLTQTITGLTVGRTYTLSFVWALAEMAQSNTADTGYMTVSLGGSSYNTSTASVPYQGFSGWMNKTFTYVATSTSEALNFMPSGTGSPPTLLVANVSLTQNAAPVPEPASLALLGSGVAGMLGLARRRGAADRRGLPAA